jgi:hypothetical protein
MLWRHKEGLGAAKRNGICLQQIWVRANTIVRSMICTNTYAVAVLLLALATHAVAAAQRGDRIVVNCEWMGGYLYGTATLRDKGIDETFLNERVDRLAYAEKWPNELRLHVRNRVHLMFGDLKDTPPYALFADYVYNCEAAAGHIADNGTEDRLAKEDADAKR